MLTAQAPSSNGVVLLDAMKTEQVIVANPSCAVKQVKCEKGDAIGVEGAHSAAPLAAG